MRTIIVEPYNPKWSSEFAKIHADIFPHVCDIAIEMLHTGSTAVPGLAAKPIIDTAIVIHEKDFDEIKARLAKTGYFHVGNLGIEGREAFNYDNKPHLMAHHLYVCDRNADELKRHIALRDFLRSNGEYRKKYSDIKIKMAKMHPHDIDNYILGKQPIILEIYEKCGLDISYKMN